MTVQGGTLRDKRPAYYSIYKSDFHVLQDVPARQRPYAIAAYNVLAFHANTETDIAFPSYNTISRLSGMSRRQAVEMVTLLVEIGLLTVEHRKDEAGDATSNEYTLVSPVVHTVYHPVHDAHDGDAWRAPPVMHGVHPNKNQDEQELKNDWAVPVQLETPQEIQARADRAATIRKRRLI